MTLEDISKEPLEYKINMIIQEDIDLPTNGALRVSYWNNKVKELRLLKETEIDKLFYYVIHG
jgi:hypothetical protein